MTRPTPSLEANIAMWAWSVLFCAVLTGGFLALVEGESDAFAFGLIVLVVAAFGSLPVAPLGLWLLHELCRDVEAQWVHVVTAVGVGALCGLAYAALFGGAWFMVPLLAASVGLARWAVVPHVPSHRAHRRAVRARRTPVDDDFAGTPPRW